MTHTHPHLHFFASTGLVASSQAKKYSKGQNLGIILDLPNTLQKNLNPYVLERPEIAITSNLRPPKSFVRPRGPALFYPKKHHLRFAGRLFAQDLPFEKSKESGPTSKSKTKQRCLQTVGDHKTPLFSLSLELPAKKGKTERTILTNKFKNHKSNTMKHSKAKHKQSTKKEN